MSRWILKIRTKDYLHDTHETMASAPLSRVDVDYHHRQPQEEKMAANWELHKDTLRTLYIDREETLNSIMACMRELQGFTMRCGVQGSQTESQFKPLKMP
jgi:hypothetical protein